MNTRYRYLLMISMMSLFQSLFAASTIQFPARTYTVNEAAGHAELPVVRVNDLDTTVSVEYFTVEGSATAGQDFTAVSATLTFAAGISNQMVVVPILNDGLYEALERFQVALTNAAGGAVLGSIKSATVSIQDNETPVQLEFGDYWAAEGEGSVLIGMVRGGEGEALTLDYATANGTALAGEDYTAMSGTLTFEAEENLKLLTIPILNDGLKESSETFQLYLTNAPTGTLGTMKTATIMIRDNDPGVQFEYSRYWIQENEGLLTVKVLRGSDVDLPPFTVEYGTGKLTALAGEDYAETIGTLAFATGEPFKMLSVPILWNQASELDTQFTLTLRNPSAGVVLGANASATNVILDMTGMATHRFDGIAVLPDRSVQLTFGNAVHHRFKDYFDLYPIEVSSNLVDWTPVITLQRTNSSTAPLTYADPEAGQFDLGYYRTVTNHCITPQRQPTGPFAVGVISRLLTDPSRRNRYKVSTNGSFMISIWYPAMATSGMPPARLEEEPIARDPGLLGGAAAALMDRRHCFYSHAVLEASCATVQAPYPVVLYSPGVTNLRVHAAEQAENLASHGYVVVAVDHADAYGTVFPDGTYLQVNAFADYGLMTAAGFQDRVKDLRFILDTLADWNNSDPVFAGRLDLTSLGTFGHSWGGGLAGEMGRIEDRVKAVILLDAYLQNADDLLSIGLSKPFLGMYSTQTGGDTRLYDRASSSTIWFIINPSQHRQFYGYYWMAHPSDLEGGREVTRTIDAYMLWYLNKYLKGSTDPMPALADYPRVSNFKQK